MENCPQCNNPRVPGEDFCDECGHKYSAQPDPQTQPDPKSLEEYEKDYVARVIPDDGEPETGDGGDGGSQGGPFIEIPGSNPIYFEDNPKTVGRSDVSDLLKSRNEDPLQVSRKQFTISKESDSYYIEDGITSVQDKASGNHTTLNGKDITDQGKHELNDGDTIGIATVLDATFRVG
mgnify:CR=1 FL=1